MAHKNFEHCIKIYNYNKYNITLYEATLKRHALIAAIWY
jgi:hypothetical protein